MIRKIRNNPFIKIIMVYVAIYMIVGGSNFSQLFAGGPSQPEMQGPSAVNNSNLVDPFTGDFSYSIPLFEMGNIPLSLNYSAGITMDQEASWVGLGWSLNPGSITRNVRGLPDDFNNDVVVDKLNIKDNVTVGVSVGVGGELIGVPDIGVGLDLGLEVFFNNYTGFGMSTSIAPSISAGAGTTVGIGASFNSNSEDFSDFSFSPSFSIGSVTETGERKKFLTGSASFSSLYGLRDISLNVNAPVAIKDPAMGGDKTIHNYGLGYSVPFGKLFSDQTYTPSVGHSFKNNAFTFNAGIGGELALFYLHGRIGGYVSTQKLDESEKVSYIPAIGYLYYDNRNYGRNILADHNREKDGSIEEHSLNLPLSQLTYDIYSISSPGISGTFRAFRNDVGHLEEKEVAVTTTSGSGGVEVGVGDIYKLGADIEVTKASSTSHVWRTGHEIDSRLQFSNYKTANSTNEKVYFAMMSEMSSESDPEFLDKIGNKEAVRFSIIDNNTSTSLLNNFYTKNEVTSETIDEDSKMRDDRLLRKTNISYYTKKQVDELYPGMRHKINDGAKDHHIVQMVATTTDGTKYVYGLPVYNTSQSEVAFNVGKSLGGVGTIVTDPESNLVQYNALQNSVNNHSGQDFYYNNKTLPPYAHTYLLTEIYSPDYVDVTGDGPTNDDLGNFVKYTYGEYDGDEGIYKPNIEIFNWRTPFTDDEHKYYANYDEGEKAGLHDDRATYIYGTKEVWYLNKIETKEYTSFFYTSLRDDGYEAEGDFGGTGSDKLFKLDSVQLVTNPELLFTDYTDFTPVKTIHFDYNYTLCDNFPSNATGGGKLTLNKVYFTYNKSFKGKYNFYEFVYDIDVEDSPDYDFLDHEFENPPYDFTAQDRWGNFKPDPSAPSTNIDFPYVNQQDANIDKYAGAWALKQIREPSGAIITLEYESDDYAYVQDQEATQMFTVKAIRDNLSPNEFVVGDAEDDAETYLYDYDESYDPNEIRNNLFVFFELTEPILSTEPDPNGVVRKNYVTGISDNMNDEKGVARNLYFKFLVNTEGFDDGDLAGYNELEEFEALEYEYIYGYAGITNVGAYREGETGDYEYGYIELSPQSVMFKNDEEYEATGLNPITKASWQYVMQNKRYNIINAADPDMAGTLEDLILTLADINLFNTIKEIFYSPNNLIKDEFIGSKCFPERSFIRLLNPEDTKKGGGYRIKKVYVYDYWEEMTQPGEITDSEEEGFTYITEYNYTVRGRSSGVAAYEPFLGGDENPMRRPNNYNHTTPERIEYQLYKEFPFGESFFPASIVGYSRVEIKNAIDIENLPEGAEYKRNATGKTVYEFYTSKDFPVRVKMTDLERVIHHSTPVFAIFYVSISDLYSGSQGYSIEINDMHGKPKTTTVYAEGNTITPISKIEYIYKTDEEDQTQLNNIVDVMNTSSEVVQRELGVTYDFCVDIRQSESKTNGVATQFNADVSAASAGFPIISGYAKFSNSVSTTSFATTTKIISRNGILEKVIATQDGSTITQSNMVFDENTGEVLLTSTQNEYDDPIYSFNYPAYWVYEEMSLGSINEGYSFTSDEDEDKIDWDVAKVIDPDLIEILTPGDVIRFSGELLIDGMLATSSPIFAWVYKDNVDPEDPQYFLIDRGGYPINLESLESYFIGASSSDIKIKGVVLFSGRRNMSSMSAENTTTKFSPINTASTPDILSIIPLYNETELNIINAGATEYSNTWQKLCIPSEPPPIRCTCSDPGDINSQWMDFLKNLILSGDIYHNDNTYFTEHYCDLVDPICEYPVLVDELDNYYYGFTGPLETYFDGTEDMTFNTLFWKYFASEGIEEIYNLLNVDVSYGQAHDCEFELKFLDKEGDPFDLTDDELYETVFGDPSDLIFEVNPTSTTLACFGELGVCEDNSGFTLRVYYEYTSVSSNWIDIHTCEMPCLPLQDCYNQSEAPPHYCSGDIGDPVNPYLTGLLGIWKPLKSYMYKVDRSPTTHYSLTSDPNLRQDGLYTDFKPFWNWNTTDDIWEKDLDNWQYTSELLLYNASVGAVESKNPLDIHSSELFGHNNTLAEMVVNNSTYKEVGFESFEDDNFIVLLDKECDFQHFDFPDDGNIATEDITNDFAHSGHFSLKIPPDNMGDEDIVTFSTELTPPSEIREVYYSPDTYDPPAFEIIEEDCLPKFSPDESPNDETYLLTMWVRDEVNLYVETFENEFDIEVTVDGGANLIATEFKRSKPIDEWRLYEFEFIVDGSSTGELEIVLTNNHGHKNIYFDDIRIQPKAALAKCYVYNYKNQWLMAEFDENHYATFYEYDEDGRLTRVKKETERGIMTIQEGRYSVFKKDYE